MTVGHTRGWNSYLSQIDISPKHEREKLRDVNSVHLHNKWALTWIGLLNLVPLNSDREDGRIENGDETQVLGPKGCFGWTTTNLSITSFSSSSSSSFDGCWDGVEMKALGLFYPHDIGYSKIHHLHLWLSFAVDKTSPTLVIPITHPQPLIPAQAY